MRPGAIACSASCPARISIAEKRWIPRRSAVLHPPGEPLFSETGHWNSRLYRLPHDQRPAGVRHAVRLGADRGAGRRHARHRVRHRLRSVPRAERRRTRPPTATRCGATRSHLTGRGDPTTVLPTRLDPQRLVAGVRPVPRRLGVLRCRRRAPGQQRGACRIVPATSCRRRASSRSRRATSTRRRCGRLLEVDPGFVRDSFWPDGMVRVSGREYNGLIESPCFKDAHRSAARTMSCFSCHAMHQTARRSAGGRASGRTISSDQAMDGNKACASVPRSRSRRDLTAHTKHQAGSEGSSCYNCHMPYTTLRPAEDDPQPHDQQPVGRGERCDRAAQRVQPLSPRQDARVDGGALQQRRTGRRGSGRSGAGESGRPPARRARR